MPSRAVSVNAESTSVSPTPTRICEGNVATISARGSRPRPASPPATRIAPAAARARASATARASGRAARAASGITDTARAATIGECLQPSIKSKTIKNSAAASAAETRPRARFAARCGRPVSRSSPRRAASVDSRRAMASTGIATAIASGTWTRKIDCQETSSVSRPPAAGPSAAPIAPAVAQTAAARRSEPTAYGRSSSAPVTAAAPPIACRQRAAISGASEVETPQRRPPRANTASPADVTRAGPSRRAASAAGTAATASVRLNATRTQITAFTETLKSR